jgi:hypothetical protein
VYAFADHGERRFLRFSRAQHWQGVAAVCRGLDKVQLQVKVAPFCTEDDPHFNVAAIDQLMDDLAVELLPRLGK